MKNKKKAPRERNWFLVFISVVLIVIGIALVILAVTNAVGLGWWSLLIGLGGATIVFSATMSIIKNDPSWVLLGLLLPY